MASIVSALDGVLTRIADLADNPKIDYQAFVIYSSWLVAAFEVYLLCVPCPSSSAPPLRKAHD
jgi:hypothetical protein